ncbi:cell division protein ZapB, partial [Treponema lecithinolyticum]
MISLEQIRILEQKVESALARLKELQNENAVLKHENTELKTQVSELNETCSRFEQEEGKIEQGILHVLNRLNTMEDTVQRTLLSDNQASQSKKEPVQP